MRTPTSPLRKGEKNHNNHLNSFKYSLTSRHSAWCCSQVGTELCLLPPEPKLPQKAVGRADYFCAAEFARPARCSAAQGCGQAHAASCTGASSKGLAKESTLRLSHRAAALLGFAIGIDPDGRALRKGSEALANFFFSFFLYFYFFPPCFSGVTLNFFFSCFLIKIWKIPGFGRGCAAWSDVSRGGEGKWVVGGWSCGAWG